MAVWRKHNNEKITANNAEIQQKQIIQHQRTTVSAIDFVTEEINKLISRKCQRGRGSQSDNHSEEEYQRSRIDVPFEFSFEMGIRKMTYT